MSGILQPAFRALSDPTRREILMLLQSGDLTVAEITAHFDMTRAAVKKHLTILEDAALIGHHVNGRKRVNTLNGPALKPVFDWIGHFDRFWDTHLSALKSAVETPQKEPNQ